MLGINYANVLYNKNEGLGTTYGWRIGGIVGQLYNGQIVKCINYGKITGTHNVGGIAGSGYGTISLSGNYGHIKAETAGQGGALIGGVIGYASASNDNALTVNTSYNRGVVEECDNVANPACGGMAGFVGGYGNKISFINCYSSGEIISDATNIGGFIGVYNDANGEEIIFTNCYWTSSCGTEYSMSTEARRAEILSIPSDMSEFKTSLGTNYTDSENNGYPILEWQSEYVEF